MASETVMPLEFVYKLDPEEGRQMTFLWILPISRDDSVVKEQLKQVMKDRVDNNVNLLHWSLRLIKRYDLLADLFSVDHESLPLSRKYSDSHLDPSRILLLSLYFQMDNNAVESLVQGLRHLLSHELCDEMEYSTNSLMKLYKIESMEPTAQNLISVLKQIQRRDLLCEVNMFEEHCRRQPNLQVALDGLDNRSVIKNNGEYSLSKFLPDCESGLSGIYPIKKGESFGHCLIIHNINFSVPTYNRRRGSEKDVEVLQNVFKELNYTVEIIKDATKENLIEQLTDLGRKDFSHCSAFVVIVLSHGKRNYFVTHDGELFDILCGLKTYFLPSKFRSLTDIPKIFFVQACQGREEQPFLPKDEVSVGNRFENDGSELKAEEDDFFFVSSTVPGYLSFRDTKKGTIFISTLCRILKSYARKRTLHGLMLKMQQETSRNGLQICSRMHETLKFDCYITFPEGNS